MPSLPCMHSLRRGGMRQSIDGIRGKASQITAAALRRFATGRGRDPIIWLIVCGCALVIAITLGTMMMVGEFRERAMANSERELENAVLLMTRHFDQQFEDAEIIANDVIAQLKLSSMGSPQDFRAKMSTVEAHQMLKSAVSVLSYVGDVMIFDADGRLINSSGGWPMPVIDVSGRAYFQECRDHPPSPPVVSEPVDSIFTGGWTTVIAHCLRNPDGV